MKTCLLGGSLLMLLASCASAPSTKATRLNSPPPGLMQKAPENVEFVTTRPDRSYLELAILTTKADGSGANRGQLVKAMRKRAAQMGCDGVILLTEQRDEELTGTCIVWRNTTPPPASPAPGPIPTET